MTIRIDSKLKREAFEVAEYYGLNISSVTHFKQMVNMHRIPLTFAPEDPNGESLEAITEGDAFPRGNGGTLAAAVWGVAVGDALGVPYEFKPRGAFECRGMVGHGTHDQPVGTWSDDTALTLATCDSIRAVGHVDADDLLARFRSWYDDGAYTPDGVVFDVGNATAEALRTGRGLAGEWDNGNGSLMRIAPLAFCDAGDDEVRAASSVTHAHPTSTGACVEFVRLLRDAAADPDGAHERLGSELAGVARDEVRSGGYVLDTLKAAKWCFANTGSYRDCVLAAVNLGSDTDTTACVAGALAGTAYGKGAIPAEWLDAMRGGGVLEATLFWRRPVLLPLPWEAPRRGTSKIDSGSMLHGARGCCAYDMGSAPFQIPTLTHR